MPNPPLSDEYRRRLRAFARWLVAVADARESTRLSIETIARAIDAGGMGKADTLGCLDTLDGLLAECWDRRPKDTD
jgi:hypothetical protein